jgi:hypothetical protein
MATMAIDTMVANKNLEPIDAAPRPLLRARAKNQRLRPSECPTGWRAAQSNRRFWRNAAIDAHRTDDRLLPNTRRAMAR